MTIARLVCLLLPAVLFSSIAVAAVGAVACINVGAGEGAVRAVEPTMERRALVGARVPP